MTTFQRRRFAARRHVKLSRRMRDALECAKIARDNGGLGRLPPGTEYNVSLALYRRGLVTLGNLITEAGLQALAESEAS